MNRSSRQLKVANSFTVPIISIKSQTCFQPSCFTLLLPRQAIDCLRDRMHHRLSTLSTDWRLIPTANSSHFVWTDEPEIMFDAVKQLLNR